MQNKYSDSLREMLYPQTKQLIEMLEQNLNELTLEQQMDLEKLKFSVRIYELEKQAQN